MTETSSNERPVKSQEGVIEQALRIVRRRKWIVLQAAIVVPLLALLLSVAQHKQYTATATLLFRQPPISLASGSNVIDPTREAATNGKLVALPVVAEQAAKALDHDFTAGEVLASVSVEPSSEADTATISATTDSPSRSAAIANAYGNAYIKFRREADRAQVQNAIEIAEASLASLSPTVRAGSEGEALGKQLDQLKLTQALQTGGAELVQRAAPPSHPSSPKPALNVALGLVLGLLLGFAIAALLERIDRRIRKVEELEEIYGLPILARIPRSSKLAARATNRLASQTAEGEAFRVLRTNLRFFDVNRGLRSILMVSPAEGDGKSTVARGLATTMAEMGDDVILVEADLHKAGEYRDVTGSPAKGLSNVLAGLPLESALLNIDLPKSGSSEPRSLTVLPSGPIPPNPQELLESERMRDVLAQLHESFGIVILDSPALSAVGDVLTLAPEVSGIVVVGGLGKTTRDEGQELRKQFLLLGRQPIGVIANFVEPDRGRYSHYYRPESVVSAESSR
ncbi:MAG TPA: GNVR domain-containing protein [Gemmatimonadales bacterium]|nr:GNVR domain-containing protein [Gemmatimonadales bacterium]